MVGGRVGGSSPSVGVKFKMVCDRLRANVGTPSCVTTDGVGTVVGRAGCTVGVTLRRSIAFFWWAIQLDSVPTIEVFELLIGAGGSATGGTGEVGGRSWLGVDRRAAIDMGLRSVAGAVVGQEGSGRSILLKLGCQSRENVNESKSVGLGKNEGGKSGHSASGSTVRALLDGGP